VLCCAATGAVKRSCVNDSTPGCNMMLTAGAPGASKGSSASCGDTVSITSPASQPTSLIVAWVRAWCIINSKGAADNSRIQPSST